MSEKSLIMAIKAIVFNLNETVMLETASVRAALEEALWKQVARIIVKSLA